MPSRKQKKQLRRIVFGILAVSVVIAGAWMFYQWLTYSKARFARYPEFGIDMPLNYEMHGIDVSKYQQTISWDEVKAMSVNEIKLGFAFIKATEGIGNTDPNFNRNWKRSKSSGITRGAYHFFIASKDGRMQAEHFIRKVKLEKGDLPPVLDVEQLNGVKSPTLRKEAKKWLDIVEEYYKVKPIIYSNADFYKQHLGKDFDDYPLWVAHYYQPTQPRINRKWHFWQHSDEGRVNGILSPVDFNVFNGDSAEFRELLIQ